MGENGAGKGQSGQGGLLRLWYVGGSDSTSCPHARRGFYQGMWAPKSEDAHAELWVADGRAEGNMVLGVDDANRCYMRHLNAAFGLFLEDALGARVVLQRESQVEES